MIQPKAFTLKEGNFLEREKKKQTRNYSHLVASLQGDPRPRHNQARALSLPHAAGVPWPYWVGREEEAGARRRAKQPHREEVEAVLQEPSETSP